MNFFAAYVGLSLLTFFVGAYIVASKKNLIRIMMGVETMILSAQALFIIIAKELFWGLYDPMLQAILILFTAIAATVVAVFMVLIHLAYTRLGTINVDDLKKLRW